MTSVLTLAFTDRDLGDAALILVRARSGVAALGLSLREDGDIEVVFGPEELDHLIEGLERARGIVAGHERPSD